MVLHKFMRSIFTAFIAVVGVMVCTSDAQAYYTYRKAVTIASAKVISGPYANYPVLINITDANLKTVANGGHVQSASGFDIVFRALDSATCGGPATCTLDHEIETYVSTTGQLVAWVRVPVLSSTTVLYIYYGDSTITGSTQNTAAVWDSNYKAVWHLSESGNGTAGEFKDSTPNGNSGQGGSGTVGNVPTRVATQIGNGESFDGVSDHILNGVSGLPAVDAAKTMSVWYFVTANPTVKLNMLTELNATGGVYAGSGPFDDLYVGVRKSGGTKIVGATQPVANAWHYYVYTDDAATHRLYIDGVQQATSTVARQTGAPTTGYFGTYDGLHEFFQGMLDEGRISNVARSAGWITTEYNNQFSPSTFYAMGTETTVVQAAPAIYSVLSGSYTGDGLDNHAEVGVGFMPDLVIIKAANANNAVWRTSSMSGDVSKPAVGGTFLAGAIKSLNSTGFTLGTNASVNATGVVYNWTAFEARAGQMVVGTFTGNGTSQTIGGVGFSPGLVLVFASNVSAAVGRTSAETGTNSFEFAATAEGTAWITSLTSDGFAVGSDARVNTSATTYYYVAWKAIPGRMSVGSYAGNATDNTNIAGVGFQSEYLLIKSSSTSLPVHKTASTGASTDTTLAFNNIANAANNIQALQSNGFQLGTDAQVNAASTTYYYSAFAACPGSWLYQKKITIDRTKVSGTQTNFPMLVSLTDTDLSARALSTGKDILFTDSDGVTPLSHEVEKYGSGALTAWVKIPRLLSTQDAVIYMYYGNASACSQQDATSVWGPEFEGVWHLSESGNGTANEFKDSTSNLNHGQGGAGTSANTPTSSTGKIANAQTFNGTSQFIVAGANGMAAINGAQTISVWYNVASDPALGKDLITLRTTVAGSANESILRTGKVSMGQKGGATTVEATISTAPAWHLFEWTWDGTTNRLYFDGAATTTSTTALQTGVTGLTYFATYDGVNALLAGQIDESRVSSVARPAGWILTEYNNQNSPSTFYTLGAQTATAPTAVTLISFTAARESGGAVALAWRTGYESNNRGFHLYREVNGVRTRLTSSLVSGSGLGATTGEYSYTWRDAAAPVNPVSYYLEDVDFDGTSVLHGPIVPVGSVGSGGASSTLPSGLTAPPPANGGSPGQRAFVPGSVPVTLDRLAQPVLTPTAALEQQWVLESTLAIKLMVQARGWYRVTQPALVAAGLPQTVDPRTLQLFLRGEEQALRVIDGANGRFDANAAIEFYGIGVDTPSTDTQAYWLTSGRQVGRRVTVVDGTLPGPATGTSFPLTIERHDRTIFFGALENGAAESWFGDVVDVWDPGTVTLTLAHLDAASTSPATLRVSIQGVTESTVGPLTHQVGVLVNDVRVGQVVVNGQALGDLSVDVSPLLLHEGDNTIGFVTEGGDADVTLIGNVQLTYAHTYAADGDLLLFTAEGSHQVTLTGFTSAAIQLLDITDPTHVQDVRGLVTSQPDGYAVTALVPGDGVHTLYAVTDATAAVPAAIRVNHPSTWAQRGHEADYVLVTHATFAAQLAPLVAWRHAQGHAVAIVDIDDLYDAFSYGEKTPQAVKDFLTRAHSVWRTAPRYVVLVGDATNDPRNYSALGDADFVPTKLVELVGVSQKTASDDWFADASGNGLPSLAFMGRLSVRTPEQADAMVAKIIGYEQESAGAWSNKVLFVADSSDEDNDFEGQTTALAAAVPGGLTKTTILKGSLGTDAARTALLSNLNAGQRVVNYLGHGSTRVWGKTADLLTTDDIAALTNDRRLPVVIAMNCLNGYFQSVYAPEASLAEALTRASAGGAIAVWASSGSTTNSGQVAADRTLLDLLLGGTHRTLGEAVAAAKAATTDIDVRRTWILFGDPALVVIGTPPAAVLEARPTVPIWVAGLPLGAGSRPDAGTQAVTLADPAQAMLYSPEAGFWPAALRQGDGFNYSPTSLPGGGHWDPQWEVFSADLDGDGFEDFFLYNRATGAWMQGKNRGDTTFAYTNGTWASGWQVRIGRLNADWRDDVFLYNSATGAWVEELSDGQGGFTARTGQWAPGSALHVGDFNGDQLTDVFLYNARTGAWVMALNDGDGHFTFASGIWSTGLSVRVANLDDDGRADLMLSNAETGTWYAALTRGNGQFAYVTGTWAPHQDLSLGDFDGDGRDDVLLYNRATGAWQLGLNTLGASTPFSYVGGVWSTGWVVKTADLDGDGRADVFLNNPDLGLWRRCLTVAAGDFECADGVWSRGWSSVGGASLTDDSSADQASAATSDPTSSDGASTTPSSTPASTGPTPALVIVPAPPTPPAPVSVLLPAPAAPAAVAPAPSLSPVVSPRPAAVPVPGRPVGQPGSTPNAANPVDRPTPVSTPPGSFGFPYFGGSGSAYVPQGGGSPSTDRRSVSQSPATISLAPPDRGVDGGQGTSPPEPSREKPVSVSPPDAPTDLVVAVSGSSAMLTWHAPSSGAAPVAYTVEVSGPRATDLMITSTGQGTTEFLVGGLSAGVYRFRVRGTNASASGAKSNEAVATIQAAPAPAEPDRVEPVAVGEK